MFTSRALCIFNEKRFFVFFLKCTDCAIQLRPITEEECSSWKHHNTVHCWKMMLLYYAGNIAGWKMHWIRWNMWHICRPCKPLWAEQLYGNQPRQGCRDVISRKKKPNNLSGSGLFFIQLEPRDVYSACTNPTCRGNHLTREYNSTQNKNCCRATLLSLLTLLVSLLNLLSVVNKMFNWNWISMGLRMNPECW